MKKFLMTLVLLVGIVFGLFAQNLTYQAVIRDNNQQLVVNTAVKATVTITFTSGAPYQAEFNGSTNLHGLLTIEFGDGSLVGRDWTDAIIAVKVVNAATPSIVYVNDEPRPVSAVPYALSVDGVAIQQYLTEHKYVTEMQVGNQIHDSISYVAGKFHTHDNMAILNATEATYTKADSLKLKGIADSAEVNVQSDWKQTDGSKDDYIKNKPSISDTVNTILTTEGYVTATALDARHYLTSDSTVITTMQGNITTNTADIAALAGRMNTFNTNVCDSVKNCDFSGNTSIQNMLQQLEARLTGKIDSLAHVVDSLAKLPHGGDTTEVADGQPCPGAPTVSDGTNTYNTVKIGNQCWMKENLRTTTKRNNVGNIYTNNTTDGYNAETYGYYYDWAAVMQNESGDKVRGICPEGWHVPSDAEWDTLTYYVYNSANPDYKCSGCESSVWEQSTRCIAKALASTTGWSSNTSEGCNAGNTGDKANLTGFSAVPAGYCFRGLFGDFGYRAYFWIATQRGGFNGWCRSLYSDDSRVTRSTDDKDRGFSVRCLRDAGTGGGTTPSAPATMGCEQVMECMGDTLGKLNMKIEAQGQMIDNLNNTVQLQGQKLDSLAHIVDSLAVPIPGGDTVKFICGTDKVTDVDNNTYNTVKIGNQCWMTQNLRTTKKRNNVGKIYTENTKDGYNAETYGYYYDWAAVMQGASSTTYPEVGQVKVQGICPTGWHVPSDAEWTQLITYVNAEANGYRCNGDGTIAKALSTTTGWYSNDSSGFNAGNKGDKSNATGFSAVPAGICLNGGFSSFGSLAYFWSATQGDGRYAWCRILSSNGSGVSRDFDFKDSGFSVRCLRDAGTGGGGTTPVPVEVSCEQVMECMGDTLGKLNTKIENLKNTVDSLAALIPEVMSVTTDSASTVTKNNATLHGNVTGMGEYSEVNAGFKYGTSESTLTSIVAKNDAMTATGQFSCDLVGLTANTQYYFKAFAANGTDTVYGEVKNFTTKGLAVATNDASNVTKTTATLNGELTVLKGYHNANAGFKYGTSESTLTSIVVKDAAMTATELFSCDLVGLTANTQYYFKAFAANGTDTVYGDVKNFTTKDLAVATNDATEVKSTAATLNGELTVLKGYPNANAGFKYGTSESTLTSIVVKDAAMTATGQFSCDLTGLTDNTQYYFKAFAANGTDTVYGEVKDFTTFTCGTSKVKDVDNNEYNTVKIGSQCWMKENLKTTSYADGQVISSDEMFNPNNSEGNVAIYGKLYTWSAATRDSSTTYPAAGQVKVQGICPAGWHVPSNAEWDTLTTYVNSVTEYRCEGNPNAIAKALADSTGWKSCTYTCSPGNNLSANNATGFSAVPAGTYYGFPDSFSFDTHFWSATQGDDRSAWARSLDRNDRGSGVYKNCNGKVLGSSVRCLRD